MKAKGGKENGANILAVRRRKNLFTSRLAHIFTRIHFMPRFRRAAVVSLIFSLSPNAPLRFFQMRNIRRSPKIPGAKRAQSAAK
ncbi:MAG: hypothetical protein DBX55_01515 [Verrucomicrobia bacterium]|nr:MAG: hypothetical protein DBX55_01515 [Verrucomicrobiota bacterium]